VVNEAKASSSRTLVRMREEIYLIELVNKNSV